jgi:hypothetical protein
VMLRLVLALALTVALRVMDGEKEGSGGPT